MLEVLHMENIAVIEQVDISFASGLSVLTGETGAGKSIVIDALNAVLGHRTSKEILRTDTKKAFVSALFSDIHPALSFSMENEGFTMGTDGTLLLSREFRANGKSICRINGRPTTTAQLRAVGCKLVNIHGQHEGQQLLDERNHGTYLDRYGKTEVALKQYHTAYQQMREIEKKLHALQTDALERERRADMLRHQIRELEQANLKQGEEKVLAEQRDLLRNGERLHEVFTVALQSLAGDEHTNGAVSLLHIAEEAFSSFVNLQGQSGEWFLSVHDRLEALCCEANDITETVRDFQRNFEYSPQELDAVENRLDQLYRLKKKYGNSTEEMLAFLECCRAELAQLENAGETATYLEKKLEKERETTVALAKTLSALRKEAAQDLEQRIMEELQALDMRSVRFEVVCSEKELQSDGMDQIRFLMSANIGEKCRPIDKIASGGELARVMLALKNVLSEQDFVETLVFDEVDTGVSGRAAQRVAEKLAQLSRKKQVLCVTHLPQIAAMGDTQYLVSKQETEGRTFTEVHLLDDTQRCEEIARLIGGAQITDTQRNGAEELLKAAAIFLKTLSEKGKVGSS